MQTYSYDRTARQDIRVDQNIRNSLSEALRSTREETQALRWLEISIDTFEKAHSQNRDNYQTLNRYLTRSDPQGQWSRSHFGPLVSDAILHGEPEALTLGHRKIQEIRSLIHKARQDLSETTSGLESGLSGL